MISATRAAEDHIAELTIDQAQAQFLDGSLTAANLTQRYLDRIASMNHTGVRLGAVLEINPDALKQAAESDQRRREGHSLGSLDGIPVLLKDNIATADQMETTTGSLALLGQRPRDDAFIVSRLRAAGAIILGKANLSEWANFRGNKSNSGWSGRGGFTRNPYVLDRNPSGSSSGSAVAVSANLCLVAVGTETDGSIISPASHCGIVGFKPTVGLVSRSGIIPIAASQDTAGPMARSVRDAALLLNILVGRDDADAATREQPADTSHDFVAVIPADFLRGKRIGVLHGEDLRPPVQAALVRAVERLRAAGAEIVDPVTMSTSMSNAETEVLLYEFKAGVDAYLASLAPAPRVKSLADVIEFNFAHAANELPYFGQETLVEAQAKGPLTEENYRKARAKCLQVARENGLDRLFREKRLDAVIGLSNQPAGPIDYLGGDSESGGTRTMAAVAGYPTVTVPMDLVNELPIGLTFVGLAWRDAELLKMAQAFETISKARCEPKFLPSLGVP